MGTTVALFITYNLCFGGQLILVLEVMQIDRDFMEVIHGYLVAVLFSTKQAARGVGRRLRL